MKKSLVFFLLLMPVALWAQRPHRVAVYIPPRPAFAGIHVAMSQDSAGLILRRIALRKDTLHVESLFIVESDSVMIFGQPAYLQVQMEKQRVKTIVINYHPLSGDRYLNLRDMLDKYLERFFGRGVAETNESITYHRWETEDGTMEVSHSDKYTRIFIRLGKPRT